MEAPQRGRLLLTFGHANASQLHQGITLGHQNPAENSFLSRSRKLKCSPSRMNQVQLIYRWSWDKTGSSCFTWMTSLSHWLVSIELLYYTGGPHLFIFAMGVLQGKTMAVTHRHGIESESPGQKPKVLPPNPPCHENGKYQYPGFS